MKKIAVIVHNANMLNRVSRHFNDKRITFSTNIPLTPDSCRVQEIWIAPGSHVPCMINMLRMRSFGTTPIHCFTENKEERIVQEIRQILQRLYGEAA